MEQADVKVMYSKCYVPWMLMFQGPGKQPSAQFHQHLAIGFKMDMLRTNVA